LNKFNQHPIQLVRKIISKIPESNVELIFEKYIDGEKDNTIKRSKEIIVNFKQLTESWLDETLNNLEYNEELGFTSKIKVNKSYKYIPLIDFKTKPEKFNELKLCLEAIRLNNIYIYMSGSSYHGYLPDLLEKNKLDKFYAKILLLGSSDTIGSIVDLRWLGHSLNRGKSVLRWSNNRKTQLPELISIINQKD